MHQVVGHMLIPYHYLVGSRFGKENKKTDQKEVSVMEIKTDGDNAASMFGVMLNSCRYIDKLSSLL